MINDLYPCIWLNGNANEVIQFYTHTFKDTKIIETSPMVTMLELSGQKLMLLDAGSTFQPNPSLSFLIANEDEKEIERLYKTLSKEGKDLMPLDKYPFSEKYAWVEDKFGISWQLYMGEKGNTNQYFTPSLMFVGKNNGKAKEALGYYTSIFPNSSIEGVMEHPEGGNDIAGNVAHAQFQLNGFTLAMMENAAEHTFNFNGGISLVVLTNNQKETDHYWDSFVKNGGEESKCGWLKDKYGVSWQIVPKRLLELTNQGDEKRAQKVFQSMLQMKKINISELEKANK